MFKPLTFVTNTISSSRSRATALVAVTKSNPNDPSICDEDDNDEGDSSYSESQQQQRHVRFELPSPASSDDDDDDDDGDFVLPKLAVATSKRANGTGAKHPKATSVSPSRSIPRRDKHSSPDQAIGNNGSPPVVKNNNASPGESGSDQEPSPTTIKNPKPTNQNENDPSTSAGTNEAAPAASSVTQNDPAGSVTPTPKKKPKKRSTVYEQLQQDTQTTTEQWKEDAETLLRFQRKIHKEKLKEIKETQDEIQKLGDKLTRLKKSEESLAQDIRKAVDQKKQAIKLGNQLKRTAARAMHKATKEKEDAKASIKAKEATLKQALKDAKTAQKRESDNHSHDNEKGAARKKRKVSPDKNPKSNPNKQSARRQQEDDESHSSDNDSDSDAEDSDWEGAPKRTSPKQTKQSSELENAGEASGSRRQTRVRSTIWKCPRCTLENQMNDHECAACGTLRPGCVPAFDSQGFDLTGRS